MYRVIRMDLKNVTKPVLFLIIYFIDT